MRLVRRSCVSGSAFMVVAFLVLAHVSFQRCWVAQPHIITRVNFSSDKLGQ